MLIIKTSPCLDSVIIIYQNQHVELTLKLYIYIYIYIYIITESRQGDVFIINFY